MNKSVIATLVTFNPDYATLKKCLFSILNQVDFVLLFDNGSENSVDVRILLSEERKIIFFENESNLGLSLNYNRALVWAGRHGFKWILFLDQDSICPGQAVDKFIEFYNQKKNENIGVLYPFIKYRNINLKSESESNPTSPLLVDRGISSGSFVRVEAATKVGGFDERYFIDYVDFEFSRKINASGFVQYLVPSVVQSHDLGNAKTVSFFHKNYLVLDKPLFRFYYIFRNRFTYAKEEKSFLKRFRSLFSFAIWSFVAIKKYSGNHKQLRSVFVLSLKDAKCKRMGKMPIDTKEKIESLLKQ